MICVFVLEDITLGVQRQLDWQSPGGIGPIADCMFMGQKVDQSVICVTHTLSGISPIIRDNAETVIMLGLPGENPRLICDTLGATPEQAERIKTLRPGEFVILNPALWEKCVYATFEKPQLPGMLDEATRRAAVQTFLNQVRAFPPAPLSAFKKNVPCVAAAQDSSTFSVLSGLSSQHHQMLAVIATGPPKPITKVYEQMSISGAQGRRISKRLESVGAIILHSIPTGRRGGQLSIPEITDYGWEILRKNGISRAKSKTNGTFVHEATARLIESLEKRKSRTVDFEIDVGGRHLDAGSVDKINGDRTFFNIGVTNPAREAENIEAILKLPVMQISKFVFVGRDAKFVKEVQKILKSKDPTGNLLRQVEIKIIADFVEI